jgi:hypothetical protein
VSVATLLAESTHESIPVRRPALATGDPTGNAILALDLGQKTGWAVRNTDGAIASGTVEFKPSRWEGGGMIYCAFARGCRRLTRPPPASARSTSRRSTPIEAWRLHMRTAAFSRI